MDTRRAIAFVMNEVTDYSYEIAVGAQSLFAAQGYDCIAITGKHLDDPRGKPYNSIYQLLNAKLFAGALFCSPTLENRTELILLPTLLASLAQLPAVSVGAKLPDYKSIVVDQQQGMSVLMDHLVALARYKRFIFVRGLSTNADSILRETIFCNRLRAHGLLADAEFITGDFDGDIVYKEIVERFRPSATSAPIPTAIVCVNDRMAVAAIEALIDVGVRVPEDVAVTGFDNSPECENSRVPLTTVGQQLHLLGQQAAQMLLDQLAGDVVDDQELPTQLVIRSSCGNAISATPSIADSASGQSSDQQLKIVLEHRDYLSHLLTKLNMKLMEQRELPELKANLIAQFPRLGISHCCIVLHENGHRYIGAPSRIFLAYDETNPALTENGTTETFDSKDLICPQMLLKSKLGSLCELTPLVVGEDCFGYMLFAWETYYFTDFLTLPVIISGALRNIYQLQSLQEYALLLEHKVIERTKELYITNRRLQHEVQERRNSEVALRTVNEKLQRLVSIDGLTQLANRAALDEYLVHLCALQPESPAPLSMLLCDIDYFKNFNDTYGHQAGDECLQAVAQVLHQLAKHPATMAARYGGEELVLLLPNVKEQLASHIAEKLLRAVSALAIPHDRSLVANHITISIGIVTIPPHQLVTMKELISHADLALYQVKLSGRNNYACYQEERVNQVSSQRSVATMSREELTLAMRQLVNS